MVRQRILSSIFFIEELIIPNPGAFITMANERFGNERYQKIGMYLLSRH
jgi:hypothetical protein